MSPPLKVLALGGSGHMGRTAVETAAGFDRVGEIVIADLDGAAAVAFANSLGGKARGVQVDVSEGRELRRLMNGADVVMNFVGPYYRFGVDVLRAAIEADCQYLDICDDWEPTLDLLELGPEAERAGVTCLIGLGASPGISNMLAATAMSRLDRVDEVLTAWSVEGDSDDLDLSGDGGLAALEHWIHQLSGDIRILEDGAPTQGRPLQHRRFVYPGAGLISAWSVGHPEPLTVARARPEVRRSTNYMVGADDVAGLLRGLARRVEAGKMTEQQAARRIAQLIGLLGKAPRFLRRRMVSDQRTVPPLLALAVGERQGVPTRVGASLTCAPSGGMAGITGIPTAIGLKLLADGVVNGAGVFAPEEVVPPRAFFDELGPRCSPACPDGSSVVEVAELVEPADPFV